MSRPGWKIRFLNWIGVRQDTLLCVRQEHTHCWPDYLGKQTPGLCAHCRAPIYFERQNRPFRKVCFDCYRFEMLYAKEERQ